MEHPVVLADGFTYERVEIMRWLHGHNTSPMTGEMLGDCRIIPNTALRTVIHTVTDRS